MSEDRERISRSFVVLSATVTVVAVAALAVSLREWHLGITPQLAVLVLVALLSENFALRLANYSMSLGFPIAVAAAIVAGPAGAGLAGAVSFANLSELKARRPLSVLCFNFGQTVLASCAGGWVYVAAGGDVLVGVAGRTQLTQYSAPRAIVAALAGGLVLSATNWGLSALGLRVLHNISVGRTARSFPALIPTQIALVFVGVLIAQVSASALFALPLFLFPLMLARQVYQRYRAMDEAFIDTIKSLVGALEAKDPYTRGHSERVADYAVTLAQHVGYDERNLEMLEKAALLHDIGKLGISSALLAKPTHLTDEEFCSILRHPDVGAKMIARIPPLKGLVEHVLFHHERFDGTGYPERIAGMTIPHPSRVLAIVDAYDAMTTNRAYRSAMSHEEAVEELRRCSGTQFDPELVDAFIRADIGARLESGASERVAVS